jgi:hypothetical protein
MLQVKKANMPPQGKKKRKNPDLRCTPGCITKLIKLLLDAAIQKIKVLGFENFLHLKLGTNIKDLIIFLLERAKVHKDTDQIEIYINEGFSICVTKAAVQKCFEFPPGTEKKLPKDPTSEVFDSLVRVLSVVAEKFNEKKKRKEKEKQAQVHGKENQVDGEEGRIRMMGRRGRIRVMEMVVKRRMIERTKVLTRGKLARLWLRTQGIV